MEKKSSLREVWSRAATRRRLNWIIFQELIRRSLNFWKKEDFKDEMLCVWNGSCIPGRW